jgi:hypothetical protein
VRRKICCFLSSLPDRIKRTKYSQTDPHPRSARARRELVCSACVAVYPHPRVIPVASPLLYFRTPVLVSPHPPAAIIPHLGSMLLSATSSPGDAVFTPSNDWLETSRVVQAGSGPPPPTTAYGGYPLESTDSSARSCRVCRGIWLPPNRIFSIAYLLGAHFQRPFEGLQPFLAPSPSR